MTFIVQSPWVSPYMPSNFLAVNEWLADRRAQLGLGQDDVDRQTKELGARVSQSYLSQLERGMKSLEDLGGPRADALRRVYKLTPEEWVEETGISIVTKELNSALGRTGKAHSERGGLQNMVSADTILVPVYGTATAGSPELFLSEANVIDQALIRRENSRNGNTLAISIDGQSMYPTIEHGDVVLVDKSMTDLEDNKLFLISIEGQGVCVKRARLLRGGQWWLMSDNIEFEPFQADEAQVIGRAYFTQPRGKDL